MTAVEVDGPFANTPADRHRARLTTASNATDNDELCVLLEMLGLRAYASNVTGTRRQR